MEGTTGKPKDSPLRQLRTAIQAALFGYDFFISYRHADAARSARSLHDHLQGEFDCFLDTLHYEAGHNLPRMQSYALKRARKLLVVVSPRAHVSPANGTDWLLAEVKEFKYLASTRGEVPQIVPIGSLNTLSADKFPDSNLLLEIPTLANHDICILDEAIERDAEVSIASVQKLTNDFKQVRRRKVRQRASWIAVALVVAAMATTVSAALRTLQARRATQLEQAFGLIARAASTATGNEQADERSASYRESHRRFRNLGLDPVMAMHGLFNEQLRTLRIEHLSDLDGLAGEIEVSADGNWILVVYNDLPPSESDLNTIRDHTAFGVFHVPSRGWTLKKRLDTPVGEAMYDADIQDFLPPHHVTVRLSGEGNERQIQKLSLLDGKVEDSWLGDIDIKPKPAQSRYATVRSELLDPRSLFEVDPNDRIDMGYGPRMVSSIEIISPDERTTLAGTYEGKILLVDNASGLSRGEVQTSPVFAAAFLPDSKRAFVATSSTLVEVDTKLPPNLRELLAPSMRGQGFGREKVLAAALSDDGATIALATTERLLARSVLGAKEWNEWPLPKATERIAALHVDQKRGRIDLVSADDGIILSAAYREPTIAASVLQRPDGPAPTVAWLDGDSASVWLAATMWTGENIRVHSIPLPGRSEQPKMIDISAPDAEQHGPGDVEWLRVHALAKFRNRVVLFLGDEESFTDDGRSLLDEQQLTMDLHDTKTRSQVLFESTVQTTGPEPVSMVTHVQSVLPGSTQDRIVIQTESDGVYSIFANSRATKSNTNPLLRQFLRWHLDQGHVYEFLITKQEDQPWFTVRHEGTGTALSYRIPWRFVAEPEFAYVAPGGRQVMLASASGEVLLIDVSMRQ